MRTLQLGFVSLLVSASLAAGCKQEVESTDIRTTGVYPVIDVTAEGSGTSRVLVKLKVGGINSNTYLDLTGPDRLTATGGGATKELDSSGSVSYAATFATEAAGPFVVSFIRGPEDDSAPNTTVDLPEPFVISPLATTELSRATGDLVFTWTPGPAAGVIDSSLYGSCIDTIVETIPDDGTATISHDRIRARDGFTNDSCSVTLTLARNDVGQVDPAFTEGGRVTATQIRATLFTSTP